MRTLRVAALSGAALFIVYVLGGVQHATGPAALIPAFAAIPSANAGPAACPIPSLDRVAGTWIVRSARCTGGDCTRAHLAPGDRLQFERDVSGAANFGLVVRAAAPSARGARTEGYALEADGIAGLRGPLVLDHDPRDGSPLDLHWLLVDLRSYDSDGLGTCKVMARIQVCAREPARSATACSDDQHGGVIIADPA